MTPLFITAERLKTFGIIDANVDNKLIEPTIIMVQDTWLINLLGTDLYNEICTQINAGTVTVLNQTLLNTYIENFMQAAVITEGIVTFNFKIGNKAVVTDNSTNQNPVGVQELELISNKWARIAEKYGRQLSMYLLENSDSYPLYLNGNTEIWKIRPRQQTFGTGIYLGNTRKKRTNNNHMYRDCCNGWGYE